MINLLLSDDNLNMSFLIGNAINLKGICSLKPKKIKEISKIGFDKYNFYLSNLCISSDDIYEFFQWDDDFKNIEPYDFIVANMINDESFKHNILEGLCFFLENVVTLSVKNEDVEFYMIKNKKINRSNFNFFIDVLKRQNCITDNGKKKLVPKNDAQKKMFIKLKENRSKYNSENNNNIIDIISSVCAKHPSINLSNVGDLSMYQLIDQYKRLNLIDEYFININSLMHGASGDNVKIKHWSSKQSN